MLLEVESVSGKNGSDCKANELARALDKKINENLKRIRTNRKKGKGKEVAIWTGMIKVAFKKKLISVEKNDLCHGMN